MQNFTSVLINIIIYYFEQSQKKKKGDRCNNEKKIQKYFLKRTSIVKNDEKE